MMRTRDTLYSIIAKHTGKEIEEIKKDADRDNYMTSEEALQYGIIDEIMTRKIEFSKDDNEDKEKKDS